MAEDDEFDETLDRGDCDLPAELEDRNEDTYKVTDEDDEPDPNHPDVP